MQQVVVNNHVTTASHRGDRHPNEMRITHCIAGRAANDTSGNSYVAYTAFPERRQVSTCHNDFSTKRIKRDKNILIISALSPYGSFEHWANNLSIMRCTSYSHLNLKRCTPRGSFFVPFYIIQALDAEC